MPSLLYGFVDSVRRAPTRPALYLHQKRYTYGELAQEAAAIAEKITACESAAGPKMVGLLASESITAYAGVLGILSRGAAVVPIDPHDPPRRIAQLVAKTGLSTLVVGAEAVDRLEHLLKESGRQLTILAPEAENLGGLAARHRRHRVLDKSACQPAEPLTLEAKDCAHDEAAYVLFAPDRRGAPRLVAISHGNAAAYLKNVRALTSPEQGDRCTHTFSLSSAASLHDLFLTWESGAALVPWCGAERGDPARFIRHHGITHWFSATSVALTMERLGELRPEAFPSLKVSLFCGEALTATLARNWATAASKSRLAYLYGPTEATVAVAAYQWDRERSPAQCRENLLPLGHLFDGQRALLVNEGRPCASKQGRGELYLQGTQLIEGYLGDAAATEERFLRFEAEHAGGGAWFRTGERVEIDDQGRLHFVERLDEQIQLRGQRIELAEIDRALRLACGHDGCASVAWPADKTGAYGLVAFVASKEPVDSHNLLARCRRHLPGAMVPDRVITMPELPRTERGSLDRFAMQRLLDKKEV